MTTKTIRRIAAIIAALGFLLMLVEQDGGPWAGTFIGLALFVVGVVAVIRTEREGKA